MLNEGVSGRLALGPPFLIFPPNQLNRRRPMNRGRVEWGSCCCREAMLAPPSCMCIFMHDVVGNLCFRLSERPAKQCPDFAASLSVMMLGKKCAMTGRNASKLPDKTSPSHRSLSFKYLAGFARGMGFLCSLRLTCSSCPLSRLILSFFPA